MAQVLAHIIEYGEGAAVESACTALTSALGGDWSALGAAAARLAPRARAHPAVALLLARYWLSRSRYDTAIDFFLQGLSRVDLSARDADTDRLLLLLLDRHAHAQSAGEGADPRVERVLAHAVGEALARGEAHWAALLGVELGRLDVLLKALEVGPADAVLAIAVDCASPLLPPVLDAYLKGVAGRSPAELAEVRLDKLCDACAMTGAWPRLYALLEGADPLWVKQVVAVLYERGAPQLEELAKRLHKEEETTETLTSTGTQSLERVVSGEVARTLTRRYLRSQCKVNLAYLQHIRHRSDRGSALCHLGMIIAHAFAHAGTACDSYVRGNLEWFSKAAQWARAAATSSLGVVHRWHTATALKVMHQYLPTYFDDGSTGDIYQLGDEKWDWSNAEVPDAPPQAPASPLQTSNFYTTCGGLLALGYIFAETRDLRICHLLRRVRAMGAPDAEGRWEHGACLALGLVAPGCAPVFHAERGALLELAFREQTHASEGAAWALGLLGAGVLPDDANLRLVRALLERPCADDRVQRSLGTAAALLCVGRAGPAYTAVFDALIAHQDYRLRLAGCHLACMLWCGHGTRAGLTRDWLSAEDANGPNGGNARACLDGQRRVGAGPLAVLLHRCAADSRDEVRRAAGAAVGFLLPAGAAATALAPLAQGHAPATRAGAALGLAVAALGTGEPRACKLLLKLAVDPVEWVQQTGLICLALVVQGTRNTQVSYEVPKEGEPVKGAKDGKEAKGTKGSKTPPKTTPGSKTSPADLKETQRISLESLDSNGLFDIAMVLVEKTVGVKGQGSCVRFGAVVAYGILNASGPLSLCAGGAPHPFRLQCLLLATQFDYWFANLLLLANLHSPGALFALTGDERPPAAYRLPATREAVAALAAPALRPPSVDKKKGALWIDFHSARRGARRRPKEAEPEPPAPAADYFVEHEGECFLTNPIKVRVGARAPLQSTHRFTPATGTPGALLFLRDSQPHLPAPTAAALDAPAPKKPDPKNPPPFPPFYWKLDK